MARWPFRNSLTASVTIVKPTQVATRPATSARRWQSEAWAGYHNVPEAHFAARYYGNSLSRTRFYIGVRSEPGDPLTPVAEDDPFRDELNRYFFRLKGRDGTLASLARYYGIQQFCAGESFLVSFDQSGAFGEKWEMLSSEELDRESNRRKNSDGQLGDELPENAYIARMWTRDPQFSQEPDSPMRAVLDIVEGLRIIQALQTAGDRSQLAVSGILAVPAEADLPVVKSENENESDRLQLVDQIVDAAARVMDDPTSPEAYVPIAISMQGQWIEKIRHIKFERPIDQNLSARIEHLVTRFARGIDLPPEILTGMGASNHWCVDPATEILTERGWLTHDELVVGDTALTLNHDTGLSEWQPVLDIYRGQADEDVVVVDNKFHSSVTTAGHRWPVIRDGERVWTTSEELRRHDHLIRSAPCADLPTTAKWEDAFVELVGWFITEGTCRNSNPPNQPQVLIGQSHKANPENVARIRRCLTECFGPEHVGQIPRGAAPTWRAFPEERGMTLFSLNKAAASSLLDVAPDRVIATDFIRSLTHAQLGVLLDAVAAGDGSHRDGGNLLIHQRNPERLYPIELAAVLAGRTTRGYTRLTGGFGEPKPQHHLSVGSQSRAVTPIGATTQPYSGLVWCPTTANASWFARRDGKSFFTGNSSWNISMEIISVFIGPLAFQFCEDLYSAYFVDVLSKVGIPDDERWKYGIGYDMSDLVVNPNRTKDAQALFDRFCISFEAYRRESGFSEDDAPTDQEIKDRMAMGQVLPGTRQGGVDSANPGQLPEGDPAKGEEGPPAGGASADPATLQRFAQIGKIVGAAVQAINESVEIAAHRAVKFGVEVDDGQSPVVALRSMGRKSAFHNHNVTEAGLLDGQFRILADTTAKWMLSERDHAGFMASVKSLAWEKIWSEDFDPTDRMMDIAVHAVFQTAATAAAA